ncbi:MAG: BlaI/MecI/CopY family transcriptional regulator [Planctomycetia bacterium]|nr:BlaI/MecI/CopY family transcriptional regulator [Planctomycetia bacterium]
MGKKQHLAELQLAIMHALWERGEATVSEVRESLAPKRSLAYTTVGTMLAKMEEKGQVTHRSDGRVNVYRPLIRQDQVSRSMVTDLVDRLFNGDVTQMVCHLLDGSEVTPESLAELKRLIRQKEKELKDE